MLIVYVSDVTFRSWRVTPRASATSSWRSSAGRSCTSTSRVREDSTRRNSSHASSHSDTTSKTTDRCASLRLSCSRDYSVAL